MSRHSHAAKAASHRQLRVGEELRHALAEVLARGNIRDPGLSNVSITVSEVCVSPDLRNATAFVMPLGGGGIDDVLEGLRRCTPYLRGQVTRLVKLKYMPTLKFEPDRSFENADRIEVLLRQSKEADGRPAGTQGGAGRSGDGA